MVFKKNLNKLILNTFFYKITYLQNIWSDIYEKIYQLDSIRLVFGSQLIATSY